MWSTNAALLLAFHRLLSVFVPALKEIVSLFAFASLGCDLGFDSLNATSIGLRVIFRLVTTALKIIQC